MYAVSSGFKARDGTRLTIPAVGVAPYPQTLSNPPPTRVLPVRVVRMA